MPEPPTTDGVVACEDGVRRCSWACSTPDYHGYHDLEWGFPVSADVRLFEKLSLEGFQAGLSWLTILRKREAFREAFASFDFERVAQFSSRDVERLLANAGIVRHRGKIEAVINNAKRAVELVEAEGSIAHYVWSFEPTSAGRTPDSLGQLPATTPESVALANDLKRRGWKFV
ncbi:MAG TPA: DNA-3-methyladenine glycosylase I, partial [Solirubrobacteraceae bacterium]|nr:DNA-3-methyladenine glycosylase I [Solirubrobacteraceae bacterium]